MILQIKKRMPQAAQALLHHSASRLHVVRIVNLFVVAEQRHRHQEPPQGVDDERNHHGSHHSDADLFIEQNKHKAEHKRNTASDIPPCKTMRGNRIQTFRRCDIRKHGIVEHQTRRVAHLCNHKYHQKYNPGFWYGKCGTSQNAHHHTDHKYWFLIPLRIGNGAADRTDKGHQQRSNRGCISPIGQIIHLGDARQSRQIIKVNGQNRRRKQHECGISYIVQNPVYLHFCKLFFFLLSHVRFPLTFSVFTAENQTDSSGCFRNSSYTRE